MKVQEQRVYRAPRRIGGQQTPPAAQVSPARTGSRRIARRRNIAGLAFLTPAAIILLVFVFYPAIYALVVSFTDSSGLNTPSFIGLENYAKAFGDPDSRHAIWNTVVYAVGYAPGVIIVALAMALLLNRKDLPLRGLMRTIIFLPFVISMAVASLAWSFLIDENTGLVPYWLSKIGIDMPDVLNSTTWAMPTVILVAIWKNFGYFMVIFLAALQGVPRELYEAAELDGAGMWRRLFSVTLPGLRSAMTYIIILAASGAFQAFDQIYVMTHGGPQRSTETIVYRVYTEGFTNFRQGYASALSFILMAITMVIGVTQLLINKRQERDLA